MANSNDDLFSEIERVFKIKKHEINEFRQLEGSNHVYSFILCDKKYVIRKLIENTIMDWRQEKAAYDALKHLNITDELISYENGIKIAEFFDNSKILNYCESDIIESLDLLRKVHESGALIEYDYDIIGNMEKYILQCEPQPSRFSGKGSPLDKTSNELKELNSYRNIIDKIAGMIDELKIQKVLCHGDACLNGNFLRLPDGSIKIIDWEQAGMADPFLDIAIASLHQGINNIDPVYSLHQYLKRVPEKTEYLRLYSYMALNSFALMAWCISCNNTDGYYEFKNYAEKYSGLV